MSTDRGTPEPDELEYEGRIPLQGEVEREALAIWRKAWVEDSELRRRVRPDNPDGAPPPLPFKLEVTQGADPISVTLLVMAATAGIQVGKTVAMDLWRKVFLPKVEDKWGVRPVTGHRTKKPKK